MTSKSPEAVTAGPCAAADCPGDAASFAHPADAAVSGAVFADEAAAIRAIDGGSPEMLRLKIERFPRRWTIGALARQETILVPTPPPRRATVGCLHRDQPSSRWRRRRYKEVGGATALGPSATAKLMPAPEGETDAENTDPQPARGFVTVRNREPLCEAAPLKGGGGGAAQVAEVEVDRETPRPPASRPKGLRRSCGNLSLPATSERAKR